MRFALLISISLVGMFALGPGAKAQDYPWCAVYDMGDWSSNCGFVTEAQCWATVHGIGGYCTPNNTYRPPRNRAAR